MPLIARGRGSRLALLLSALLLACSDPTAPVAEGGPEDTPALREVVGDPHPSQEALARAIPGFGGFFFDTDGEPTVYLEEPGRREIAQRALQRALSARGIAPQRLRVRQGRFRYDELEGWYRLLRRSVLGIEGVVFGDVDEGRNRIRFGVASPIAGEAIRALLQTRGIPLDAVVLESRGGYRTLVTLRDRVRPLGGGLQINFFATPSSLPGPSYLCTLGFNADVGGVRSFITNSHCTNVEGGIVLATEYYQNRRAGGTLDHVGVEVDDPAWSLLLDETCPIPLQCRYSDAARVAYDAGSDAPLGAIARIDAPSTSLADTTHDIIGAYTVSGERADPMVGEVVHKVGRTTGWTFGPVTATCVDVLALGTTHMRLCQSMVSALVDGGDSGSPVFSEDAGGATVTLLGILWGGSVDEANPEFVFSPMSGIERELGALTTH